MENEDKDASKLTNASVQVEDDSSNETTATATITIATVMDSNEAVQGKTEPQCEPESAVQLSESELPPQEQSLGEGKGTEENEMVRKSEAVAGVNESKLGGGGDESPDSEPVVTMVVGEEDGAVSNAADVVNAGDLVVSGLVVGGGEGDKEGVIGEGEREEEKPMHDVAEGKEEKADLPGQVDFGVEMKKVDLVEEKEIADDGKGDEVGVIGEREREGEKPVDDVAEGKEEKAKLPEQVDVGVEMKEVDVVEEAMTENETEVDDVTEAKEIVGEQKWDDVAVEAQIEDETKVDNMAEETGTVDDRMEERVEIVGDRTIVGDSNVFDVAEPETADETKAVDVAVETSGRAGMAGDREIAGEMKVVNVAEDKEMAKEINVADFTNETMSAEDTKVADPTETKVGAATDEMEVGDVIEGTEVQEEETEVGDVAEGEAEVEEPMERATEETEMQEATETDEMEMGDVGEETLEAGADIGDEMEKAEMAEEMEVGEDLEEVSRTVAGKRKRFGKNSKSPGRATSRKKSEDVCFICFDGGELVLCDRR